MTLNELKWAFHHHFAIQPNYYLSEDGSWWGDFDAWQIRLGQYWQAMQEALALGLSDSDVVDSLVERHGLNENRD